MTSDLILGNKALKEKNYAQAFKHYHAALARQPELARMIKANIQLVEKKLAFNGIELPNTECTTAKPETIDIVVPVYNALDDVKLCLHSLARHTDGFKVRVLVVNDGSDEVTTQWLREFCASDSLFQLIEHPANKGYTCAVNTGLRASTADYVITQNSDTIVPAGWLQGMVRCMKSDHKIGVVGPLSNAASWQNVPVLRDESGGFAVNDLPQGQTVDTMAKLVASASNRQYPRLPFVNGFCFMIRRSVIDSVGYMDEENFPVGYGEENDYCIRVADAGFELVIADDVYVFHAKSKSFGHERRKFLSERGTQSLKQKHTPEKYAARVAAVKRTDALDAMRVQIQAALAQQSSADAIDMMSMRVLFLLPVGGGGGGAHSVVQEVTEMRRMGVHARVAVKQEHLQSYRKSYSDIPNAEETFLAFDDSSLVSMAEDFDIVVGTIFNSMTLVKRIVSVHPHILPAYYVQDYEPMFFKAGSPRWHVARESYTLVPDAFLFAKTHWIIDEVKRQHGVTVHKVKPSIDHEVYKPVQRVKDGRLHVTAMIRPQTPYRGAARTMRLFTRLHHAFGDRIQFHTFGCENDHPEFLKLERNFPFHNHGPLLRPQVASLLANSDLFIDLSDYQAFGRTGLEAMACRCAAVVPAAGGANEYAIHDQTSLVVDTSDEEQCFQIIGVICIDLARLQSLQRAGLSCAARYSVHHASVSECICLEQALQLHRKKHPKHSLPILYVLPNRNAKGEPLASAYVRLIYPYQSEAVSKEIRVKILKDAPEPESNATILVQRHLPALKLPQLRQWISQWKASGGRIIFDIDDDMLDTKALKARHFSGDVEEVAERVRLLTREADLAIASTTALAEKLRTLNSKVALIPNTIDGSLWCLDIPRDHQAGAYTRRIDIVRIGYIGTPTHDEDLALITPAIKQLEARYGDRIQIEVIGGFESKTPTFGKRIPLPKKNDYPNFVNWLHARVHWDIAIIPLKDDDFNRSKSNLKFLECAALDTAIVVSDAPTYRTIAKHEKNCLVSTNDPDHWVENLSRLIEDSNLRQRLASCAREEIRLQHTTDAVGQKITSFIGRAIHTAPS